MKWSKLIGLLVAALGIGTLCCSGAHLFGSHLRYIQNPMDNSSGWSFIALDLVALLLIALSYFVYRARNWARLAVIGGCVCYSIIALVGGVLLGWFVFALLDVVFVTGILILCVAGPLFLIFVLRQPEVVKEFAPYA
jgi:hypothetical protein